MLRVVFAATLVSCSSMHSSLLGWKKNIRTSLGQVMYKVAISIKQHGNLFHISCVWISSVGEKRVAKQEFNNPMDKHAVRVVKGDKTVLSICKPGLPYNNVGEPVLSFGK